MGDCVPGAYFGLIDGDDDRSSRQNRFDWPDPIQRIDIVLWATVQLLARDVCHCSGSTRNAPITTSRVSPFLEAGSYRTRF